MTVTDKRDVAADLAAYHRDGFVVLPRAGASFSDRVRSLLGYSIHPPFMGHIDGLHPLRHIDDDYDPTATRAGTAAAEFYRSVAPRTQR